MARLKLYTMGGSIAGVGGGSGESTWVGEEWKQTSYVDKEGIEDAGKDAWARISCNSCASSCSVVCTISIEMKILCS
jgi:hypothetical protein